MQRGIDQQTPALRRARQVPYRIVDIEYEGIGQFAHVAEAALGTLALNLGDSGLARGHDDTGHQNGQHQSRGGDAYHVSPGESAAPVAQRAFASDHGHVLQVTPDVLSELICGGVATLGFLAQRHQRDVVEVAAQAAAQLLR